MDINPGAAASVKRESRNGDGNTRGIVSIVERRAAKCGFKMKKSERINTARFRTTSPLNSPSATPFIIIPPGVSPTALLDTPVVLPNSHGQSSSTTGDFPSSPLLKYGSLLLKGMGGCGDGDRGSSNSSGLSFRFKPYGYGDALPGFFTSGNQGNDFDFEANILLNPAMDFQFPVGFSEEAAPEKCTSGSRTDVNVLDSMIGNATCSSDSPSNLIYVQSETIHEENIESHHHLLEEQKGTLPATAIGRTSDDGYNWRKYGKKLIKGSEHPRSYYKCNHENCLVKKKIECAHDGQITEIIYKGTHNHPQPQPGSGAPPGPASSLYEMPEMGEGGNSVKVKGGSDQKNRESGSKDIKVHDGKVDGLERTSSTSVVTELSDPLSAAQVKSVGTSESTETPELSSTLASHDDDDDGVTQGSSFSVDVDESESKRRKIESSLVETNMASRLVREPRVVVQVESEVDILDDGYRWRKYGQKVVKGNPNPRSYYKCTSPGCSVRKHVERGSRNLKHVITTYEGKHDHEVPASRNSSRGYSAGSNLSLTASETQPALALARNTKAQVQEFAPSFDRKPVFNNDYLRSKDFPGNFSNEMNLWSSSIYSVKFPPIQNVMPYDSFGFNNHHLAANHSGSVAPPVPDFPRSLSPCLQTAANLSLARDDCRSHGKPDGQAQTFLQGQQW